MTKSDKLKIVAVTLYMLNPLGILAMGSSGKSLAHHNYQNSSAKECVDNASQSALAVTRAASGRQPASVAIKYRCAKKLAP